MTAEILCVGTELLMGQVLNTNAQFLSKRLCALGIRQYHQQVVGDNEERLEKAYRLALSRADVVITSGGLGPTVDDITKRVAARVAGKELVLRDEAKEHVERWFHAFHKEMTANNLSQAMFTSDSILLPNAHGTAPGAIVPMDEKGEKIVIHLPGPPIELQPMFLSEVEPYLRSRSSSILCSRYIRIFGMGESEVDMRLADLEIGQNPTLSPYCSLGEVQLRASAEADMEEHAEEILTPLVEEIRKRLGDVIYDIRRDEGGSLALSCMQELKSRGMTVAAYDAMTCGLFGSALMEDEKGKQVFRGSRIVTDVEGLSQEQQEREAEGVRREFQADVGLCITQNSDGDAMLFMTDGRSCEHMDIHLTGSWLRRRELCVKHALHQVRRFIHRGE